MPRTQTKIYQTQFNIKDACRVATTANITLVGSAPDTLDGISLALGNRVLVKNQTTPSQNGIYEVSVLGSGSNGTWVRTTDFDDAEVTQGMTVAVVLGNTNTRTIWILMTADPIVIDTTALTFNKIPIPGQDDGDDDTEQIDLGGSNRFLALVGASYTAFKDVIYLGASKNLTKVFVLIDYNGVGTVDMKIFDVTNAQTIAEKTGITTSGIEILDLGTISNLPSANAQFEVQFRKNGGGTGRAYAVTFQFS